MNERIRELRRQATLVETYTSHDGSVHEGKSVDLEKFADLIVSDYAKQLVQANMNNHWYVQAMDEYYEQKWAHRFD
jgi:hypothetical protein